LKTSIVHISEFLWQKFEKMNNWSLQLMSIIKSGYFIIKKIKFQAILTKIQFSVIFGIFFSVFDYFFALKSVGSFFKNRYLGEGTFVFTFYVVNLP
jgi:hypothetical protein